MPASFHRRVVRSAGVDNTASAKKSSVNVLSVLQFNVLSEKFDPTGAQHGKGGVDTTTTAASQPTESKPKPDYMDYHYRLRLNTDHVKHFIHQPASDNATTTSGNSSIDATQQQQIENFGLDTGPHRRISQNDRFSFYLFLLSRFGSLLCPLI